MGRSQFCASALQFCENESDREAHVAGTRTVQKRRKRWLIWTAAGVLVTLAGVAVVLSVLLSRAEPYVRTRIVAALTERFHARIELDSFHLSLIDGLRAEGKGLRIWPPAQAAGISVPGPANPLIQLDEFSFHAPLAYRPGQPIRISKVELKGLVVDLPPHSHFTHSAAFPAGVPTQKSPGATDGKATRNSRLVSFQVDSIECTGARLILETSKPGKLPVQVEIALLNLTDLAADRTMNFEAELTNPRPVGTIHTTGSLGPWSVADPGESPVAGSYHFEHADLSTFKGIAGKLNSTGSYKGTLRDLEVDGQTETADFRLSHFGNALALRTRFHAEVDATNGDTRLESVDATLGSSHFTASGQIARAAGVSATPSRPAGHDISLNVVVDRARVEDFLRLSSHSPTPFLTGALAMKTTIHIPPGPVALHQRMKLDGTFHLDGARFTSPKIQQRIAELSLRGEGQPEAIKTTDPASILAQMQGNFALANGILALPAINFTVPGAAVQLGGTYGLDDGALDFTGSARMKATVSKMVGGWKGMLLKPADRFFKRDGAATEVPITLKGTREDPKFGIDFDRMKTATPQRSGP
jgi:hypothetical protein